jgi:hypothetical protein
MVAQRTAGGGVLSRSSHRSTRLARVTNEEAQMPVAIVMEFAGGTLEQYDEVIAKMGFSPGGAGAPGGMFHWVTQTDDGIRVTDVWQTREQFDAFAAEKIGPITAEVGIPGPPQMTYYEVHNYLTEG